MDIKELAQFEMLQDGTYPLMIPKILRGKMLL